MDTITEFPGDWPLPLGLRSRSPEPGHASRDDQLVAAAKGGDDEAFVRIVEIHQDAIFRFCRKWLRDEEDAKEATQDTFVRAYLALGRYRKKGRFSTWLFQIALNQCRDRLKSKSHRQSRVTRTFSDSKLTSDLACPGRRPDEVAVHSGEHERLREAISRLPMRLRAVVIICGLEGMSQETCAEILNLSVRAVEGRFYRARRILEEAMESGKEE